MTFDIKQAEEAVARLNHAGNYGGASAYMVVAMSIAEYLPAALAEIARLRALVKEAYIEGFDYNSSPPDLREEHWAESDTRRRLEQETKETQP